MEKLEWTLPKRLLDELLERGEVYFVGGTVRDFFLGIPRSDQDILVAGIAPDELVEILRKYGYAELVGRSFNVIKFHYGGRTHDVALPSRRGAEGAEYDPNLSVEEDLTGRDFTVNAIAFRKRVLRTTTDEVFRFDPLRIIRLCRLAAKLKFDIDPCTKELALASVEDIKDLPPERVGEEMNKIMLLPKPSAALRCLVEIGAMEILLPELVECIGVTQPGSLHSYDVFEHIMLTIDYAPPNPLVRFAALFHDITKPQHRFVDKTGRARFYGHQVSAAKLARKWLEKFAFSKKFAGNVAKLVRYHMYTHAATDKGVRRFIQRVGEDLLPALFELRFADTRAQGPAGDLDAELQYAQRVRKILEEKPPLSVRDLEVNGYDVMRILGIPPGPKVGEVLNYLLAAVIDDPDKNRREILEEMIRNYDKKEGNNG